MPAGCATGRCARLPGPHGLDPQEHHPGDDGADHVEGEEHPERIGRRLRRTDVRHAQRDVDEHAAERADRAGEPDQRAGHPARPGGLLRRPSSPRVLRLGLEDRRDHLVRRAVADAREHEQQDETGDVADHLAARGGARRSVVDHPGGDEDSRCEHHRDERVQRDPAAADPVGELAAERAARSSRAADR